MFRCPVARAVLLCVASAAAAYALPPILQAEPRQAVGIELASLQSFHLGSNSLQYFYLPRMGGFRVARLTVSSGRLRAGVGAFEGWFVFGGHDMAGMGGFAPLYLDLNLYRASRRNGSFYRYVPDVYLSTTFVPIPLGTKEPVIKAGATCDLDFYGVGVGFEASFVHGDVEYEGIINEFGIGIRLRAGIASIRF